jgi:hypothetical protein
MRRVDEQPIDPEVADALDAIDATLAGEAVEPRFAELAELALLLSAGRPQPDPGFAASLDQRVARRFAPDPAAGPPRRRRTWWALSPAWGGGIVAAAAVLVVGVVLVGGGGSSHPTLDALSRSASGTASTSSTPTPAPRAPANVATFGASASSSPAHAAPTHYGTPALLPASQVARESVPSVGSVHGSPAQNDSSGASLNQQLLSAAPSSAAAPTPLSSDRKAIQSAQLSLTTPPSRIDAVAQEVFNVVGAQSGFVQRSNVTAGGAANSYAQFQLSVPSSNLSQTMSQLSQLKFASVSSRTDATQDVNDQYVGDVRRLSDAKALRTALLKQLAQAVTTVQIDSLNQQIHDAEQAISADQSTLNGLNHQIDYSQIQVTINGALIAPARHHKKSTGFTLGKAAHDSGRVLTIAAGVALIALAALVPVALLAALGWWVVTTVRRRRREQALDLA